ncbi:MAG: dynamin family protein [Rubellimicrobium sp.]|nr:dynamin family protein [Rubellimicrobium sp.]
MSAPHPRPVVDPAGLSGRDRLVVAGMDGLFALARARAELGAGLVALARLGDRVTRRAAERLMQTVGEPEPSVTLIGQVKAGKTTLLNAMIGRPGLLPADVNPWTSVVTSLHLCPPVPGRTEGARFRFFDEEEWARLVEGGGRLGELAARAGAGDDLERVRDQIARMRERSRKRLGRRFELLMGQEHEYGYVDAALIERYVCLGDDPGAAPRPGEEQGRFADITRTAMIDLTVPGLPLQLCLRDTPGVNDTFMMREQITIGAIRESRICIVVLSAPQAMTAMDLALMRLIANVRARDVIVFVNRIDELADPVREVPMIRARIRDTLGQHDGPTDAAVIFGSAFWASACLTGTIDRLPPDSAHALLDWAPVALGEAPKPPDDDPVATVWALSGIPALWQVLSDHIAVGQGREGLSKTARSGLNLVRALGASEGAGARAIGLRRDPGTDPASVSARCAHILSEALGRFDTAAAQACAAFAERAERAHRQFIDRATHSLIAHLEAYGDGVVWTYGADGLRVLLRSSYLRCGADLHRALAQTLERAAQDLAGVTADLVELEGAAPVPLPPEPSPVPPPVSLGQSIALDLQAGWWRSWWYRARGYEAFSERFSALIAAETGRMLADLREGQLPDLVQSLRSMIEGFVVDQTEMLVALAARPDAGAAALDRATGLAAAAERRAAAERLAALFEGTLR